MPVLAELVPSFSTTATITALPRVLRKGVAGLVQRVSELKRGKPVLPRPPWTALDAIPIIGFHLVDAIRSGKVTLKVGTIDRLVLGGVTYGDGSRGAFDPIILATGFEPALDLLGTLIQRDERGFAIRRDNVTSADQPGLLFVGQRYDSTGALANIKADAIQVARILAT